MSKFIAPFRLKPLNMRLALSLSCLPISAALLYSPEALASTCAAANASNNTVSANCEDLTWTSGNLTINNNAVVSKTSGPFSPFAPLIANGSLGNLTIDNGAQLTSTSRGIRIVGGTSIGAINNSGSINSTDTGIELSFAITPTTVTTINNTGTIASVNSNGIGVSSGVTVTTINNLQGTITGHLDPTSYAGISNNGSIGTLNNSQMGLTYRGAAPSAYNIYITSTSNYGTLTLNKVNNFGMSALNFGIAAGSTVQNNHKYLGVIQTADVTTFDSTATKSGTYTSGGNSYNYSLLWNGTAWDLLFGTLITGPSAADTQESLKLASSALRKVYNVQSAVINNSLYYDCTVFASNNVCVSGGGRFATTNDFTGDKVSTLLVAAYKPQNNIRVGAFIDQNALTANVTGIEQRKSPMYGLFGVWNQNADATGYEVRLASSYSKQDFTQTREVVGTSEAGAGSTSLTSQALTGEVSYAMNVPESAWIAKPYVGLRQTSITRHGYTESNSITAPLTYSDLKQSITTALTGVRMSKQYGDDLNVMASVGVEQNMGSSINDLNATGVTGLTATDFSANYSKTRPVATVGVGYAVAKDQRIHLGLLYRKEAFQSSGSTTGLLMYQIGL